MNGRRVTGRSRPAHPAPTRTTGRLIGLLALLLCALWGCRPAGSALPLPTRAPTAKPPPPETDVRLLADLPATFTPPPILEPAATPSATPTPTATALPTETPIPGPTATRNVIPSFLVAPVDAAYREAPPDTTPCGSEGTIFRSEFPSRVAGPNRSYHVYLPPCYGVDGRTYPVLYLIHGSVQTDSHWLDLGLARHADAGISSGRYPPFIAIMPHSGQLGNVTSGGNNSIEGVTVNSLLPFVDATYCSWAEPAGRAIGGISRGGYWALMIAFRHSHLFTAVSGHSSHLRLETDPAQYNPLVTYAAADLSQMRIWLDWGERDFLRVGQQQLHESLTTAGIPHEAIINTGGHSDQYWQVHLYEYLDWHAAGWPLERGAYPLCAH